MSNSYIVGTVQNTVYNYLIYRVRAIINLYLTGKETEAQRAKELHSVHIAGESAKPGFELR